MVIDSGGIDRFMFMLRMIIYGVACYGFDEVLSNVRLSMLISRIMGLVWIIVWYWSRREMVCLVKIDVIVSVSIIGVSSSFEWVVVVFDTICRNSGRYMFVFMVEVVVKNVRFMLMLKIGSWNSCIGRMGFLVCCFYSTNSIVSIMLFLKRFMMVVDC